MKRKQRKPPWSEAELHLLRSKYPLRGAQGTASLLPRRTPVAVRSKAHSLGLGVGDITGWVPTSHITNATGFHPASVRVRALASGHAKQLQVGSRKIVIVPEAWANAYVRMAERARNAEELAGHHYTTTQVARIFGVHGNTIRRWLRGTPLDSVGVHHLARVRVIMTSGRGKRQYLFNPHEAESEARAYREHQRSQLRSEQNQDGRVPVGRPNAD